MDGVNWYIATAEAGGKTHTCEAAKGTSNCEIQQLSPYTDYTVNLMACDKNAVAPNRICSNVVTWKKNPVKTLQSSEFSRYPLL